MALGVVGVWVLAKALGWSFDFLRGQYLVFSANRRRRRIRGRKVEVPVVSEEIKDRVLSLPAWKLVEEMKAGRLKCVDVMATYIERAGSLGREMNLTGEELFAEALAAAAAADRQRETEPESMGLLFGLPVSIKDHIVQRGCTASAGVIGNAEKVYESDSDLVAMLRNEGAIPFVRSNLTQVMMWFETECHLYGRAENPWDRKRSTGGSSGGEGGLIAARCSPLGIGSDIGGSIRTPACWCGVYAIKPTPQRVRFDGVKSGHPKDYCSMEHLVPVAVGPFGNSVQDLTLVLKSWWQSACFARDQTLVPLPFNTSMFTSVSTSPRLRIGFLPTDPLFPSHPAQTRLLNDAKSALVAQGHEVVDFHPPNWAKMIGLYMQSAMAVGTKETDECLQGEPACWFYRIQQVIGKSRLLEWLAMKYVRLVGFGRVADLASGDHGNIESTEFMRIHSEIQGYRLDIEKFWRELELDVVLCPAVSLPAPQHGMTDLMIPQLGVMWLWNLLEFPAGIVPVGQVYLSEETYDFPPKDGMTKRAQQVMKGASGLPVALQVAALPYEDEKALGLMQVLENYFAFHKHPI